MRAASANVSGHAPILQRGENGTFGRPAPTTTAAAGPTAAPWVLVPRVRDDLSVSGGCMRAGQRSGGLSWPCLCPTGVGCLSGRVPKWAVEGLKPAPLPTLRSRPCTFVKVAEEVDYVLDVPSACIARVSATFQTRPPRLRFWTFVRGYEGGGAIFRWISC